MLQAIVALYFGYTFYEGAEQLGKNKWLWFLIGSLSFFLSSSAIVLGLNLVSSVIPGLGQLALVLVFVNIGVGLYLGYLFTNFVKNRYRIPDIKYRCSICSQVSSRKKNATEHVEAIHNITKSEAVRYITKETEEAL